MNCAKASVPCSNRWVQKLQNNLTNHPRPLFKSSLPTRLFIGSYTIPSPTVPGAKSKGFTVVSYLNACDLGTDYTRSMGTRSLNLFMETVFEAFEQTTVNSLKLG